MKAHSNLNECTKSGWTRRVARRRIQISSSRRREKSVTLERPVTFASLVLFGQSAWTTRYGKAFGLVFGEVKLQSRESEYVVISKKLYALVFERDKGICAYSGVSSDRLVVHHRANRGMGGAKSADVLANLVLVDSILNGRFEDDLQTQAGELGFKISRYARPDSIPLYHAGYGEWVLLTNDGKVKILND